MGRGQEGNQEGHNPGEMMEANEVPIGALRGATWYLLPRSVTGATAPQIAPAAFVPRQGARQSVLLIDGKCHRPINSNPENL